MSDLLNQASLVMVPSGYKEDTVYSVVPSDGSGDLSFTRASNGTRVNSAGLVEVCPWNLLQYSEQFTNAIWTPKSGTFTDNFATAPNGTQTAAKWQATDSDPYIYQAFNGVNVDYTATCWVKATGTAIGKNCSIRIGSDAVFTAMTGEWQQLTITANINGNENVGVEAPESATSGEIVYIWGFQLNIGSTAKPYFPTTDRLNVPRLTYQNGGGGCPSLLLEKQSTNLVTYSAQFDNAAWSKQDLTVTANATTSPDGTTNAQKIVPNTTNGTHYIDQFVTISAVDYTYTIYAKKGEYNYLYVNAYSNSSRRTWFDLNSGTVSMNTSPNIATIESVGNGWYRCTITNTSSGTTGAFQFGADINNGTINANPTFSGDGTSGIYVWGAQLEASSYATSYIPTTSSSATRVADYCSKTGISSLIGQTEGTVFIDFVIKNDLSSINRVISITETTWDSGGSIRLDVSSNGFTADFTDAGLNSGSIPYNTTPSQNTRYKVAIAYKQNDCKLYINGVDRGSDTSTNGMPTCSQIYLNELGAGFGGPFEPTQFNQVALFKTKLTDAECIALTTI